MLNMNFPEAMQEKLFCYGTLKDALVQEKLFGRRLSMRKATLKDWKVYIADGYLFISPAMNSCVQGYVITLDKSELLKADQWEEVPLYTREKLSVLIDEDFFEDVWVYTRRAAVGIPLDKEAIAAMDYEEILREIEDFNRKIE